VRVLFDFFFHGVLVSPFIFYSLTLSGVEKYRPKKLDDICHQDEAVRALRQCLATSNVRFLWSSLLIYDFSFVI
jgi:hypothetical protein